MFSACDISKYQGAWQDYPADIVMIKMSGGDVGLYLDPDAGTNYTDAKAAGKHVGGYHFVGWTEGADQEAAYFLKAMSPLAENDVYALDAENGAVDVSASSPAYLLAMAEHIHNAIGVWPLVYMNLSTLNTYNWDAVLANCGLWLADWNGNPNVAVPTQHIYVMQQYSDGPSYDHDEYYGPSLASFDAYGYHAPVTATPLPPPTVIPPTITDVTPPPVPVTPPVVPPTPVVSSPNMTTVSVTKSNNEPVIERDLITMLGKYNKLLVAVGGGILTYLSVHYSGASWLSTVTLVATALGIFQFPNTKL